MKTRRERILELVEPIRVQRELKEFRERIKEALKEAEKES